MTMFMGKAEGKNQLGKQRHRKEDNIKTGAGEIECRLDSTTRKHGFCAYHTEILDCLK